MAAVKAVDVVLAFLLGFVQRLLANVAQGLWDEVWEQIVTGVARAEQKWTESGQGAAKKTWVVDTVMEFVLARAELNWLQRQIVKLFVGRAVDAVVQTVNDELGKDWADRVKEFERELAAKVPFIR